MSNSSTLARFRDPVLEQAGAVPYGCDFQVHAPPTDWPEYAGSGKNIEDYLREDFLPRVFASGRQVIGVPQHNAIGNEGGAKKIRDVARQLRASGTPNVPVVFPGYELTSADQIQLILLADPDLENVTDLDTRLHQSLRLGESGRAWHESAHSLEKILEEVHTRFPSTLLTLVVGNGHKGLLEDRDATNRNRENYKRTLVLADGVILSKTFAACHPKAQQVLRGELADYGARRCPYVQSSDARSFGDLSATARSHVKLGSFTIEGVRQALLNSSTFVRDDEFAVPNVRLLRLQVRNTVFFDSLNLDFSSHLTTLVGGRGTGKSCLLEYIAHVCDFQRSSGYDRPNAQILVLRKDGSGEGTLLANTEIELHVCVGEKYYRFQRIGTGSTAIFECADSRCDNGVAVPGASAAALINLRFFGQRELANIVRNTSFFALDPSQREGVNLFSFLKSEQLTQVGELERQATTLIDGIKKLSIDLTSWSRDMSERKKLVSERERLQQDLEKIKKQAAHPAFQTHRSFLDLGGNRDGLFANLTEVHTAQVRLEQDARKSLEKLRRPTEPTSTGAEPSLLSLQSAAISQVEEFINTTSAAAASWKNRVEALRQSTENSLITEALTQHTTEYESAKKSLESQKINLALLEPLQKRVIEIDGRLKTFEEVDARISGSRMQRRTMVHDLREIRRAQGDVYVTLAEQLTHSTNHRVRMRVVRAGDLRVAVMEMYERNKQKQRFRKPDAEEMVEVLTNRATASGESEEPAKIWTGLVDHLLDHFELQQDLALGRGQIESSADAPEWLGNMGTKLRDVVAGFDDEQIGGLLCQYVPDAAKIELRRKPDGNDYLPIAQASVGQKATALFLILLAQTDGLLVIDQPEDDLDNAFISDDILPAIRELKHEQQVVFATHNANMLVNAEAEKVVVLDTEPRTEVIANLPSIRGRVEFQGGIDQTELRDRITTILEGGREAFLSRERKYRFNF